MKFGHLFSCLLLSIVASPSYAQQKTIEDGVFTEAQVAAGKQVYDMSCGGCHNMDFYRNILRTRQGAILKDLWWTLVGSMPEDNPGSLADDEYTTVIAYILAENGFPAGESTLDPNNGMDQIKIVAP